MSEIKGRAKGGIATAAKMTEEQRKARSMKGVAAKKENATLPRATHGSPDRPLRIGDLEITCYVLENNMRVLSGRGMQTALALGQGHGGILKDFVSKNSLQPFIGADLAMGMASPIKFIRPGRGGKAASGYEATILADICDAVLSARAAGTLSGKDLIIANQCEVLVRGFARVGIIALVDEATGYQKDRAKDELAKILEAFVAKELQPWVKTFPFEFYENMFRLRGLPFPTDGVKRPQYFGHLTNDIIYRRLAPGVWRELKEQTEKDERGRLKNRLHQKLTTEIGHPKLKDLVISVITVMKLSDQWQDFKNKLDRVHPAYNETMLLPFDLEGDSGRGI